MKKLLVFMVLSFILAYSVSASAAPAASGTPQSGGILKMFIVGDPNNFYPPTMTGQLDGMISGIALETLFMLDQKGDLAPFLATGYKADPTAKTITISLRKGVKFHDGSDFNAAVAKWNMEQFRATPKGELNKVTSIDVMDDYTLRLNLSAFDNTIITNLASCADAGRMISQKSFDANGGKAWAAQNPIGTGPFQFVKWTKSVDITWKRFDGYWGGKPYLDGIQMKEYANTTAAKLDFKAGNLDIFRTQNPHDAKELEETGLYNVVNPPEGQVPALAGYAIDPASPFAKLEVRQALSYAIDVKALNNALGLGYWKIQNQWAIPDTWGYNTDIKGYPYDPQKAKDLLAKAGYPQGFKTTLNFLNLSPTAMTQAVTIINFLKAVGIEATLNPALRPAFAQMAAVGKGWPGIIMLAGNSRTDPLSIFTDVVAKQNFVGIALPQEVIDAHEAAIKAPDQETKKKLTWKFMALTVDKYCMASFLYIQQNPVVKTKKLHDDLYGELPNYGFSPKAWLSK